MGSDRASFEPAWFISFSVAHFAVAAYLVRWWALLLPLAIRNCFKPCLLCEVARVPGLAWNEAASYRGPRWGARA